MNLPFIDRIWRIRGSLMLGPAQFSTGESPAETFGKLEDLFQAPGTSHDVAGDTLTFAKKDPIAQDRMAVFNRGTLRLAHDGGGDEGALLHYDLNSPTLLFCFVLPFLFLAIAWLLKESRNPAFVFAGIFATLYVVGRVLEPWLIRKAFRKRLCAEEDMAGEVVEA